MPHVDPTTPPAAAVESAILSKELRRGALAGALPAYNIGMTTFLHTADWQIGKPFGQFTAKDDATVLAEARFSAVETLARLAAQHAVDAVLVAGDVFDAQGVADRTIVRLFHAMAGYAGPWVLLPGNHDAALAESVWTRARRLAAVPDNVHLCLSPDPLILDALRVAVLPAPLTQRITHDDLTQWFDAARTPAGFLRIGLAHGSVQGLLAEGIDATNPIAADRAARARLDYLALGDWHGTRQVDARTWYSGTPETDRFRANASGQALLVTLDDAGRPPDVQTLATGRYRWQTLAWQLHGDASVEAAMQDLAQLGSDAVVQLRLEGQLSLAAHARLHAALTHAQGRTRSLEVDATDLRLEPSADDLQRLHAQGYVGEVITTLQAQQQQPELAEVARDALALLAGLLDRAELRT